MAGNLQISVKDEQSARQWLALVQEINEDYRTAMKDAGDTLADMQNFSEGTLVDDFVEFGTNILNIAESTFQAIDTIADTVNAVLDKVKNFTENVVGGIASAVGKIFG